MYRSSTKPQKFNAQFADATNESLAAALPNSNASPSTVDSDVATEGGISRKFQYYESVGYNLQPIGRGQFLEKMRKECPDLEDSEVKDQLNECTESKALHCDESWLKRPQELEEDRKKWEKLLNSAKNAVPAFTNRTYRNDEDSSADYIPYNLTAQQENSFVWKDEDFPPLG